MDRTLSKKAEVELRWGEPPWRIEFQPEARALPDAVDVAIVGGGFTGLAAAAWLRRHAPERSVALLEGRWVGAGASGRTGGVALGETAAGDLPELGDVLAGFARILGELRIECGLKLSGAWEIGRRNHRPDSSIAWRDSGGLGVVNEVPGGTVDPGKLLAGLACAAACAGAILCERSPVLGVEFGDAIRLTLPTGVVRAKQVLFATNTQALELSGLAGIAQPMFSLAVKTQPLSAEQLQAIGLRERKPFYTVDLPYLWGRVMSDHGVVFGSGLVHVEHWSELEQIDAATGKAAELLAALERRVRGLHPTLSAVRITHRWGGPILFAAGWRPVFTRHPQSGRALVLGAYAGHGVALSLYLGCWAAEVLLGRRDLPSW